MRVLLADDHAIVRQGLRVLLESKAGAEIVAEAADGREALRLAEAHRPEMVILDVAMPGLNGLEALLQLRQVMPETKVIILSMHVDENYVTRAIRYGASGYVYKGSAYSDLEMAMQSAERGETFLSAAVSQALINDYLQSGSQEDGFSLLEKLSPREREILQLLAEGHSRTRIAQTLSISPKTVDRHRENLREKLQAAGEEDLFFYARRHGLTGHLPPA